MDFFSIWHLLVILVIVVVLFGTSKLRNVGSDLGNAIKSFRSAVKEESEKTDDAAAESLTRQKSGRIIDAEANPAGKPKARNRNRKG